MPQRQVHKKRARCALWPRWRTLPRPRTKEHLPFYIDAERAESTSQTLSGLWLRWPGALAMAGDGAMVSPSYSAQIPTKTHRHKCFIMCVLRNSAPIDCKSSPWHFLSTLRASFHQRILRYRFLPWATFYKWSCAVEHQQLARVLTVSSARFKACPDRPA